MQRSASPFVLTVAAGIALSALVTWARWGLAKPTLGPETGAAAAGMVIYRDPATGELGIPPPDAQPPAASAPSVSVDAASFLAAAPAQWRQVPVAQPAQGWKLEGPMLTTMTATVGADGKLTMDCGAHAPGGNR